MLVPVPMRAAIGVAVLLGSLGRPVSAAGAALTLADALARAHADSPELKAAAADLAAAQGRLLQAGVLVPNPVLSGEAARHSNPAEGVNVDRGVALAQEIEIGGQRGLRVEAARHDVARAERALADRTRTVDGEVRRAFAGSVAADRRGALADQRLSLANRLLEAARKRAHAGDVGTLDVELAQIEQTSAEQARAAAETDRARAVDRLATVLGAAPGDEPDVVWHEPPAADVPPETALVARALQARPDLAAAREEHVRLETEATLTRRRGTLPNPTLRGWYREEQRGEHIAGGGVDVPLPVFDRQAGAEIAQRAQASAAAAAADRLAREIPRAWRSSVAPPR